MITFSEENPFIMKQVSLEAFEDLKGVDQAKELEYNTALIYIFLAGMDIAIDRVNQRIVKVDMVILKM